MTIRTFCAALVLALTGCAAALVPATSDPNKKLADAYYLLDRGRTLPAKKLMEESLAIWQERKDQMNTARAHSALGDLYRNGRTQGDLKLPNHALAIENYKSATDIYKSLKEPKWAALNLWPQAVSFHELGDLKSACAALSEARKLYKAAPDADKATETFEKAGAFSLQMIEQDWQAYYCKSAGKAG